MNHSIGDFASGMGIKLKFGWDEFFTYLSSMNKFKISSEKGDTHNIFSFTFDR